MREVRVFGFGNCVDSATVGRVKKLHYITLRQTLEATSAYLETWQKQLNPHGFSSPGLHPLFPMMFSKTPVLGSHETVSTDVVKVKDTRELAYRLWDATMGDTYSSVVETCLTCLDDGNIEFGNPQAFQA